MPEQSPRLAPGGLVEVVVVVVVVVVMMRADMHHQNAFVPCWSVVR